MTVKTLRRWIDAAGPADVASRCGCSVETLGRWAIGSTGIPSTRVEAIKTAYRAWKAETAEASS